MHPEVKYKPLPSSLRRLRCPGRLLRPLNRVTSGPFRPSSVQTRPTSRPAVTRAVWRRRWCRRWWRGSRSPAWARRGWRRGGRRTGRPRCPWTTVAARPPAPPAPGAANRAAAAGTPWGTPPCTALGPPAWQPVEIKLNKIKTRAKKGWECAESSGNAFSCSQPRFCTPEYSWTVFPTNKSFRTNMKPWYLF